MSELWQKTASELTAGYGRGEFTPAEAVEACFDRLRVTEPHIAAFLDVFDDARRDAAASGARWRAGCPISPLDGVPVSVKDNLHVAGHSTTWGSRTLQGFRPAADELPVARARAAGMIFLGKTNLPEFAMRGVTVNALAGASRNPFDTSLTPGGSTGGGAAAVAAGVGPLALATDGGGSIRRPASHCGLVGFKPSAGRVPRAGGLPEMFGAYEVAGAIGRDLDDVIATIEALAGAPLEGTAGRRILHVPTFSDAPVDSGIAAEVRRAAQAFADLGFIVDEAAGFDLADAINSGWTTLFDAGLAWMFADLKRWPEWRDGPGPEVIEDLLGEAARASLERGRAMSAAALFDLLHEVDVAKARLAVLFEHYDAILTPATAALPWPAAENHPPVIAGHPVGPRGHAVFTAIGNAAGLPGLALPTGWIGNLPTGIQLLGRPGGDADLLALGRVFTEARPFDRRWPLSSEARRG
jgi:aspartyl-tRNA(Asn)/glutamyl-tRNA(Gln) amidotransferase subunit A